MRIGHALPNYGASPTGGRRLAGWCAVALLICSGGCRRDMYDQPHYEAYEPSTFFSDGTSSRPLPVGTVARGDLRADTLYYEGKVDGKDAEVFPFAINAEILETGRERYMVYCTPCHGRLGDGRGMVVRRGFSPPPSFHSDYLRKKSVGHIYNVITHGYGAMYSYAARIPVQHRWAIAAYIRALQYSTDASPDDLDAKDREFLAENDQPGRPTRDGGTSLAEVQK